MMQQLLSIFPIVLIVIDLPLMKNSSLVKLIFSISTSPSGCSLLFSAVSLDNYYIISWSIVILTIKSEGAVPSTTIHSKHLLRLYYILSLE